MDGWMREAAERAEAYLDGVNEQRVWPDDAALAQMERLGGALPARGESAADVVRVLDEAGSGATVASAGARYFGFVIGGALPATVGASWLASAWDQNAGMVAGSPVGARLEEIAAGWVLDVLGLPADCGVGFVTGATSANFTAMCAARHVLLERAGWDVEARGLYGAPEVKVVVGEAVHASVKKALAMVGFGRDRVIRVPMDEQGRMVASELPELDSMTLVCAQAGEVNTGAFDPFPEICARAREAGAWVHVDGAFGLWALACPTRAGQAAGVELADSWALDCHKWLNVPYDSGLMICRDAKAAPGGLSAAAAYLIDGGGREPYYFTPELSRRARGVEVWAAMRSLGREGLSELVERCCVHASRFAEGLSAAGFEVLNEVRLNQVMVRFGDDERTRAVIEAIQRDGTCWCGGTTWRGQHAMRISVSSWATTGEDVERSLEAMVRCAKEVG